ncbi:MAG: caspase family protein [Rhodospirillaceae bacterium]|nr:caspase family protein [Rhodospirillaceae bacterium]
MTQKRLITRSAFGHLLRTALILTVSATIFVEVAIAAQPTNSDAIAVIIANSEYRNEIPKVDYASNDGDAMKAFLRDVLGYRDGNIIDLRNAGQADILAVFGNERSHEGKLWSWVRPGRSDVFVYYSGHGAPGARDKRGYLLPVDSDPATVEINGYPLGLLYRNLAKLRARSVTVMLDACFSGASEGGMLIKAASPVFVKTVASEVNKGITVLSAARGDQLASWDREAKLGLFTSFALKGLYGEADKDRWGNGDGKVTLAEVRAYLDDEMSYAARRRFKRVQHASAIGDPKTVLVAVVKPKVQKVAALPSPPIIELPKPSGRILETPKREKPRFVTQGNPGGDLVKIRKFVQKNRVVISKAIRDYYQKTSRSDDKSLDPTFSHSKKTEVGEMVEINSIWPFRSSNGSVGANISYMTEDIFGETSEISAKISIQFFDSGVYVLDLY